MQVLSATLQLLEGFNDGLGHATVRFFGTSDDGELFAGGDALVTVFVVETDAEQSGFGRTFFRLIRHAVTVSGLVAVSSGFSSIAVQIISVNASSCLICRRLRRVSSSTARNVATR